jgi:hypothetical protein
MVTFPSSSAIAEKLTHPVEWNSSAMIDFPESRKRRAAPAHIEEQVYFRAIAIGLSGACLLPTHCVVLD